MKRGVAIAVLAVGCLGPEAGVPSGPLDPAELEPVAAAFQAAQPDALLDLVLDVEYALADAEACAVTTADDALVGWAGPCELADGALLEGTLRHMTADDLEWVAGDGFRLTDPDGFVLLQLDGAVEVAWYGELVSVEASLSTCGGPSVPCDEGLTTLDLAWTLFPWSGFPIRRDLTVNGVVALGGHAPVAVYGAWTVDDTCAAEPTSGSVVLDDGLPYGLDFDGAVACDRCARLTIEGLPVEEACTDWLLPEE